MAKVCALFLLAIFGAAHAVSDESSLVQKATRIAEGESDELGFDEEVAYGPLLDTSFDVDLDDVEAVQALAEKWRTLEEDMKVTSYFDQPPHGRKVTKEDLGKAREIQNHIQAMLRDMKIQKMNTTRKFAPAPKIDLPKTREFYVKMHDTIYPRKNPGRVAMPDVAHIVAANGAMCLQAATLYLKRVLIRLDKSPLEFGFRGQVMHRGPCRWAGFKWEATTEQHRNCWKQATVWMDNNKIHQIRLKNFHKDQVKIWGQRRKKTTLDAYDGMQRICLKH